MPPGPRLALGEVGLAQVEARVEVAERLGDGLDPLPVHHGLRVAGAGVVVGTGRVQIGELAGVADQLLRLVADVRGVLVGGGGEQVGELAVGAPASPESVTVNAARMPSPTIPGLHAVT